MAPGGQAGAPLSPPRPPHSAAMQRRGTVRSVVAHSTSADGGLSGKLAVRTIK